MNPNSRKNHSNLALAGSLPHSIFSVTIAVRAYPRPFALQRTAARVDTIIEVTREISLLPSAKLGE